MNHRKPKKSDTRMATNLMQRSGRARLSKDLQQKIGHQLRAMYDDVVRQGVPDRFAEMLSQLEQRESKEKN